MNNHRKRLAPAQKKALQDYVKKNPAATYVQFCKDSNIKVSDAYYYSLRRQIHGTLNTRGGRRNSTPVYLTVWQYSTERLGNESRVMLEDLVNSLNIQKRTRWQLIELKNPAVLELRERGGR